MQMNQPSLMVIENDPIDILIFKRVLADMGFPLPVVYISDGEKALKTLDNPESSNPWLIFLDLNIPRISGIELLSRIKRNGRLKWIPVVVISSSENPDDIVASANAGACGYLLKEFDYSAFRESVTIAVRYWARNRTPIRTTMLQLLGL